MKVLSSPSLERDFRHLLIPTNLKEVFDFPEEFILPKVPHLNFEGSGCVRAKEWVMNHLLGSTKEASEEMLGGDVGSAFPLLPPPCCAPHARLKRLRELEVDGVAKLR